MCNFKNFRFILGLFIAFGTIDTITADTEHSGGYQEAKTSAASEMHLIIYANELNLGPLRERVALLKNPEVLQDIVPDDHDYLKFLAQELKHYEAVNQQNKLLQKLCSDSVDAQPDATRDCHKLFGIPVRMRAKFVKVYNQPFLDLYDRAVLAYGVTPLNKALKKQLVPSEAALREQWEAKKRAELEEIVNKADGTLGLLARFAEEEAYNVITFAETTGFRSGSTCPQVVRPTALRPPLGGYGDRR